MFRFEDPRLPERFWRHVIPEPNTGCWLWTSHTNPHGYGQYSEFLPPKPRTYLTHRFTMMAAHGAIADGLVIDHRCMQRVCCNPAHLEAVTIVENNRRTAERRTHCPHGHPYSGDNLIITTRQKQCRECNKRFSREYQRRKRAAKRAL